MLGLAVSHLFKILDGGYRRCFAIILLGSAIGGVLDLVGLAAVAPFVAVAVRPELVVEKGWLSTLYNLLPWGTPRTFVTFLGIGAFVLMSTTLFFRVALYKYTLNFAESLKRTLTVRLARLYLAQPYQFFLGANNSDLKKHCSHEVNQVVQGFVLPLTSGISSLSGSAILVLALLWMKPTVAILFLFLFGLALVVLYRLLAQRFKEEGKQYIDSGRGADRLLDQAFCGLRELKLAGREKFIVQNLEQLTSTHQRALMNFQLATEMRVSALRFLGLGGLIFTTLLLINSRNEVPDLVPVLGVLILATYRLLPSIQGVLNALGRSQFSLPVLESISQALDLPYADGDEMVKESKVTFTNEIQVRNLTYTYPGREIPVTNEVNLTIPKASKVGLVGRSGAGKTTLLDLLAGLLPAEPHMILIDGEPLHSLNVRAWREKVGYVPQKSFLLDDTIKANIALGIDGSEIDLSRLEKVARAAQLHDFVASLPKGYNTRVGQDGTWLSGGQKQRIAIARALYREPELLILDEATNALDVFTEQKILNAVSNLQPQPTLVIVTHRLDPLRDCDNIFLIDGQGRLADSGPFDQLMGSSWLFRKLAGRL